MSESPEKHPIANDLINLVIAVVPWLFPDSSPLIKVLTSLFFGVLIIIARKKPDFVTNLWNPFYYILVISLPIAIAFLSWKVYELPIWNIKHIIAGIPEDKSIFGLGFGIIVGVPLSIFGAYTGQNSKKFSLRDAIFNLGGGCGGCLIQIVVFILLFIFSIATLLSGKVETTKINDGSGFEAVTFDKFLPPPMMAALGSVGPFVYYSVISYLASSKFNFAWFIGAFLLNTFFVITSYMLGKIYTLINKKRPTKRAPDAGDSAPS